MVSTRNGQVALVVRRHQIVDRRQRTQIGVDAFRSSSLIQRKINHGMTTSILIWSRWKSFPVRITSKNCPSVNDIPVVASGVRLRDQTTWPARSRKNGFPPDKNPAGEL